MFVAATACSCAFAPPVIPPSSPAAGRALYEAHAARVAAASSWDLTGRVSVSSEQESWQANLHWQQTLDAFDVLVQGPLGQGSAHLRSGQGYVVMESSDGSRLVDVSAAQLLQRRLGWVLPVEELRYWVRGVAAPGSDAEMEWDEAGQLQHLQQNHWDVRYKSYVASGGLMIPSKLFLVHEPWQVRLVIDVWGDGSASLSGEGES